MHEYRVIKCHVSGRTYVAVVADMHRSQRKGQDATRQGRVYPHVFCASRNGWTRTARAECYAWIRSQGQEPTILPQDREVAGQRER